jgi:TP901 family phage tail tape measure protein
MANAIGFGELFNKEDFNSNLEALKGKIEAISKAIDETATASNKLNTALGGELKEKVNTLTSSNSALDTELRKVRADFEAFKQTVASTKTTVDQYKTANDKLKEKVKEVETELKKLNATQKESGKVAKQATINYGQLSQSLIGVASGAALLYKGISMLKEQITLAVKSTIEFESVMKEVQAITRSSATDLALMTSNANRLGATTEKTASQIGGLQKELAKLGLNTTEILASTDAIVDLSTATGENLVSSATIAASTMRAFGLEATDMTKVVNVMAGSFVRSGLDLEKFRESIKLVAPIARATNISLEMTTASLSKLADAGLSGSLAGTALRNLFSNMADPTSKLAKFLGYTVTSSEDLTKAFKDLRDRGVDLAQAVQMVDVRARPAFFTLLNQVDAVEALALEYRILDDEANKIAETMRDTLENDILIASSAFDALRRNITEKSIPAMRAITQDVTTFSEFLRFAVDDLYNLSKAAETVNETDFTFGNVIKDLIPFYRQYQEFVGAMEDSNSFRQGREALNDTAEAIGELNREMEKSRDKIFLMEKLKNNLELHKDDVEGYSEITEIMKEYGDEYKIVQDKLKAGVINEKEATEIIKNRLEASLKASQSSIKSQEDLVEKLRKEYNLRVEKFGLAEFETHEFDKQKTLLDRIKVIDDFLLENRYDQILINKALSGLRKSELGDLEELERIEAERLRLAKEAEALRKKQEAEAIKAYNLKMDAFIKEKETGIAALENAVKIAEAEGDKMRALALSNKVYEERAKLLFTLREKELENIALSEDSVENKLNREKVVYETHYQKLMDLSTNWLVHQMKAHQASIKSTEASTKEEFKLSMEAAKKRNQPYADFLKQKAKDREKDAKKESEIDRDMQMLLNQSIGAVRRGFDTMFDYRKAKRDEELDAISRWEAERVRLAGDNEEAIAAIREQGDAKRRVLLRKNAKDERAQAMFNIALNTAQAVVAALRIPIGGIPLSIAIGAIGAAQLALVASKPLPEFYKGTDNAPEGHAWVGERGRELVKDGKTGKVSVTPDKPTIAYLTKGSVVIPHEKTERILASHNPDYNGIVLNKSVERVQSNQPSIDYDKLIGGFKTAVKDIPLTTTNFDENGVRQFVRKGNARIERLNARYKY